MTYLDIITGALKHLTVLTAETELTAAEAQDGLNDLNDMGVEWEVSSPSVGFVASLDVNSQIDLPRHAVAAFKANLALRLAPQYEKPVTASLAVLAADSLSALIRVVDFIGPVELPDTLPVGSGNECPDRVSRQFFKQNSIRNF